MMENRKGFKQYMIKGFASGKQDGIRLFRAPKMASGLRLFFGVALAVVFWFVGLGAAAGVSLGLIPAFTIDKSGASGDNLKMLEDLEKRMGGLPEYLQKQVFEGIIKNDLETRFSKFDHLSSLTKEQIAAIVEGNSDGEKGYRSILLAQGKQINELKEQLAKAGGAQDLSIRSQVEAWRDKNKLVLEKLSKGEKVDLPALEIRVANSPMTPSNTYQSTTAANNVFISSIEIQSEKIDLIRLRPTFWDYIKKGKTSAYTYIWVNKKNPEGAAGWIGPGVPKPGVSLEQGAEASVAKKIAASAKLATELLQDVDGFASFIQDEMKYQLKKEANDKLMTGVADATNINGIRTISVTYSLVGISTVNPNYHDCLRAMVAQLRAGNFEGVVTIFINPVDKANMDLTKSVSEGQLFNPAPVDAVIVEDNNIPVGFAQAAILDYYKILIYKDFTVSFGFENDDFTKNLVTWIAEMRVHQFVSENHVGFAIYDSFANIQEEIAAA